VFPEGFFLAMTGEGAAIGYFCAELWKAWDSKELRRFDLGHDPEQWLDRSGETLYVSSMTVDPAARSRGWGRRLFQLSLERLLNEFPSINRVALLVNEHWTSARHLYESEGFREVGRLPDFFQPEGRAFAAAVVMERVVKQA